MPADRLQVAALLDDAAPTPSAMSQPPCSEPTASARRDERLGVARLSAADDRVHSTTTPAPPRRGSPAAASAPFGPSARPPQRRRRRDCAASSARRRSRRLEPVETPASCRPRSGRAARRYARAALDRLVERRARAEHIDDDLHDRAPQADRAGAPDHEPWAPVFENDRRRHHARQPAARAASRRPATGRAPRACCSGGCPCRARSPRSRSRSRPRARRRCRRRRRRRCASCRRRAAGSGATGAARSRIRRAAAATASSRRRRRARPPRWRSLVNGPRAGLLAHDLGERRERLGASPALRRSPAGRAARSP